MRTESKLVRYECIVVGTKFSDGQNEHSTFRADNKVFQISWKFPSMTSDVICTKEQNFIACCNHVSLNVWNIKEKLFRKLTFFKRRKNAKKIWRIEVARTIQTRARDKIQLKVF